MSTLRPRRPWWKRAALGAASAAAFVLVLRLVWGAIADHRLAREWERTDADPLARVHPEDPSGPIDPQRNGAPLIVSAIEGKDAVSFSPGESSQVFPSHPPFPPAWHAMTDAAVGANARTLALLRESRGRPEIWWDLRTTQPFPVTKLSGARGLANLVCDAAMHAHVNGDDLEAVERLRDVVHLSEAMGRQPYLISHMVSIGIDALAMQQVQVIAPGLTIPPGDESAPLRRSVRALLDELLDESDDLRGITRALATERPRRDDEARQADDGAWLLEPMYKLELARVLAAFQTATRAATQPTLPAAKAMLAPILPSQPIVAGRPVVAGRQAPRFSRLRSDPVLSSLGRFVETDLRMRGERRFAAVCLAVHLYRADHAGAWPPTLDALVPRYLPAVPGDVFAPDGRPIGYLLLKGALPDGGDRPLLHTVGPDGQDDYASGAGAQLVPTQPESGWIQGAASRDDQFRDLARWSFPAQPAPATATAPATTSPAAKDAVDK